MIYHVDDETVRRAEAAVRPRVKRTRLVRSAWLSSITGGEVLLKCEHEQVTGSFKVRGAVAKLASAKADRVAAASAGNHGLGLAWAAREAGIPCTIFVPRTLPRVKEEKIVALRARLVKAPFDTYDPTQEYAKARLDGALLRLRLLARARHVVEPLQPLGQPLERRPLVRLQAAPLGRRHHHAARPVAQPHRVLRLVAVLPARPAAGEHLDVGVGQERPLVGGVGHGSR